MKILSKPIAAAALSLGLVATATAAEGPKSGYVEAGGIKYYYEIHGEGAPLLLLHGGLGSTDMFAPILPRLTQGHQVIGVDLQGHGRTELGNRPMSLEAMGDDIATILKSLGHEKVDVLGYSFGGGVAFRFAVQHPEMINRVALVSAGYAQEGFYADMIKMQVTLTGAMADMMKDTPMYKGYKAIAPHPEDFPKLLDAMGEFMRKPYDYSNDVPKLKMPVMLVFGDSDMYRPEHEFKFYQMLGGGLKDAGWMRETMSQNRLAIIPNRTHYDIFFAPELANTVMPFFDRQDKVKTWDEQVDAAK
ncbi:alpha/beta hydrolase (plasmid) [Phyllobacterium sp. 628]|uniref:alpha/beta fold hydrolase n=1 Tax=Phyllobacterium sp. 628 TaxID=2718938 RepID=UPI001662574E|nr:alpha/beta hydrolase [Phyllobacterium sp. 628]QND54811.1 alpha/beta hydrolase [Phyllobacterium sp. 628]